MTALPLRARAVRKDLRVLARLGGRAHECRQSGGERGICPILDHANYSSFRPDRFLRSGGVTGDACLYSTARFLVRFAFLTEIAKYLGFFRCLEWLPGANRRQIGVEGFEG